MSLEPKRTILLQLDVDSHPSVFDAAVAVDSGVDVLLRHGGVTPEAVRDLVHGAIFTRSHSELNRTAIFVGGSDVVRAEAVLEAVKAAFFGPNRVSVLFDPHGSNTTAVAASMATLEGCGGSVKGVRCAILGGTGPVGQRAARLLARLGASVSIGSRQVERAREVAGRIGPVVDATIDAFGTGDAEMLSSGLSDAAVVIAAGAAGVTLLPEAVRSSLKTAKVFIDLNAVPPAGIEGVSATDKAANLAGAKAWGAIGIGGVKMKIHQKAIRALYQIHDRMLDAEQILDLARA